MTGKEFYCERAIMVYLFSLNDNTLMLDYKLQQEHLPNLFTEDERTQSSI